MCYVSKLINDFLNFILHHIYLKMLVASLFLSIWLSDEAIWSPVVIVHDIAPLNLHNKLYYFRAYQNLLRRHDYIWTQNP